MLPHARIVQRGPAHTGFTVTRLIKLEELRLIKLENCLARRRSRMKEQQRKSEEEDAEAAIAKHQEDRWHRSPAAGDENLGAAV